MKTFLTVNDLREELNIVKAPGKSVGFVPTMGALHEGHLALVKQSLSECDITVVSIFVNPKQFNNPDDLAKYPRNIEKDANMLQSINLDILFIPTVEEMYPSEDEESIDFGDMESVLEGKFRPGHFQGVGLIVSKFFSIVKPDKAYFGQKDIQQFCIIRKLVQEKFNHVNLISCPIVREGNGLAMSSRNERLSAQERSSASVIYESLKQAKQNLEKGVQFSMVQGEVQKLFLETEGMELEYFEMVETQDFTIVSEASNKEVALCIAVNVGDVRLIDNIMLFS